MPDGPVDAVELEIDKARLNVQKALDVFCEIVKQHLRDRRGATDIDPDAVLPRPEIRSTRDLLDGKRSAEPKMPEPRPIHSNGSVPPSSLVREGHTYQYSLSPCQRAILTVLVQHGRRTAAQIAILAGYSQKSGGFNGALADLRSLELIDRGAPIAITTAGRSTLGSVPPLPSGRGLLTYWIGELNPCEGAILKALEAGPLTKGEVADLTNYTESGGFNGALAKLRKLGLVQKGQPMRIAEELR
jgi:hypothetical protein